MSKTKSTKIEKVLRIKKCAVCGKSICRLNYEMYAYKSDNKFFCGYSCMQTARKNGLSI